MLTIVAIDSELIEQFNPYYELFDSCLKDHEIRFITWNRKGTDLTSAFYDNNGYSLKDLIQNKQDWRLMIVSDDRSNVSGNPFDNQDYEKANDFIRICQKLGYIAPKIKFVRENDDYKSIIDEYVVEQEDIEYPENVYLISIWKYRTRLHKETSTKHDANFWDRCGYPSNVRYMKFNLLEKTNIETSYAYFEAMMLIHTLAYNVISSNFIQAYNIYNLKIDIDQDTLFEQYNSYYNRLVGLKGKLKQFHERIISRKRKEMDRVSEYAIQVEIDLEHGDSVVVDPLLDNYHLFRNDVNVEEHVLEDDVRHVDLQMMKASKEPIKSLKKASKVTKLKGIFQDEYLDNLYLDEFQLMEIEEELRKYEIEMINAHHETMIQYRDVKKRLDEKEIKILEAMQDRPLLKTAFIAWVIVFLAILFAFIPFMNVAKTKHLIYTFVVLMLFVVVVLCSVFIEIWKRRRTLSKQIDEYNKEISKVNLKLSNIKAAYSKYLSSLASYMKGANLVYKTKCKDQKLDIMERYVVLHSKFVDRCIKQVSFWKSPLNRNFVETFMQEMDTTITLEKKPQECKTYHFHNERELYPCLYNGDLIVLDTPYPFIHSIEVKKEDVYD